MDTRQYQLYQRAIQAQSAVDDIQAILDALARLDGNPHFHPFFWRPAWSSDAKELKGVFQDLLIDAKSVLSDVRQEMNPILVIPLNDEEAQRP